MSSAVESSTAAQEAPEPERGRWPLLPDNDLTRANVAPWSAAKIVRCSEPAVRRSAIAITTRYDVLRRVVREEAALKHPRQEMLAMANQQLDRLETEGFTEGSDADE